MSKMPVGTTLSSRIHAICESFGVEILYVFGSAEDEVRNQVSSSSSAIGLGPCDVDVGVRASSRPTVREKARLAIELEDAFGASRVDLVLLDDETDPFLAANIIRGERLYARDSTAADEYDLYVLRRAGDLIPLERERLALIMSSGR